MINKILNDTEIYMKKCLDVFEKKINKINIGRASPSILDDIKIKCYDSLYPLSYLSTIIIENANTLIINVFDISLLPLITKTIINSNLGLNPSLVKNSTIKIFIPSLTEEKRIFLIKKIHKEAEQCKISLRNIRRDSNIKLKKLLKEKIISNDENIYTQNKIQKITNLWIKKIEFILNEKETKIIKF